MVDFSPNEMLALSEMINPPDEHEDMHVYGSALNPASATGRGDKEIAKPNVAVEVKVNNRAPGGGAPEESVRASEEEKRQAAR